MRPRPDSVCLPDLIMSLRGPLPLLSGCPRTLPSLSYDVRVSQLPLCLKLADYFASVQCKRAARHDLQQQLEAAAGLQLRSLPLAALN